MNVYEFPPESRTTPRYGGDGRKSTALLIIDPQNDFHPGGSLAVAGADSDAERISRFILDNALQIDDIFVTLDTHQKLHIAHPMFWKDQDGEDPAPFTIISSADVESGKWACKAERNKDHALRYVKGLEAGGKFSLCIWPYHCLVGTVGHAVTPHVQGALHQWETDHSACVRYVLKGNNALTEHYSALKAEVEIENDPHTAFNTDLFDALAKFDRVIVCGQAKSHCVNFTVRDLVSRWPKDETNRIVLLDDAMSSVGGFEEAGDAFIKDMEEAGLVVCKCDQVPFAS